MHNNTANTTKVSATRNPLSEKDAIAIIGRINALMPGESITYLTHDVTWSNPASLHIRNLLNYFERLHKYGKHSFTQRVVDRTPYGLGIYDYMIKRIS